MIKKVIVYDDNKELLNQYNSIFYALRKEFQLEASFTEVSHALIHLNKYKPDVVLMDIKMLNDEDGLVALYDIKKYAKETKVLMLMLFENNENILNALCLNADGFMMKSEFSTRDMPHEAMRKALRVLFEDDAYMTPIIAKKIVHFFTDDALADKIKKVDERFKEILTNRGKPKEQNTVYKLTKKQLAVLEKIVGGNSTEEIAAEMDITENTVNTHIKAIFRELEVHSRARVIRKAIEEKIIDIKG
jgi:DNA-binding NarL/FixJ family response regulator